MSPLLDPAWFPVLLAGALMVGLALWLFILDPGSAINRGFALLLTLRGLTFVVGAARGTAETEAGYQLFNSLGPYLVIPLVPVLLYFLSVYPHRRGPIGNSRIGPWLLLAATLGLEAWYLFDHSAYGTVVAAAAGEVTNAGPGHRYDSYGPLIVLTGLRLPAFAFAALVLARDHSRQPHGSAGYSRFLVYAGFALNALFDGVLAVGLVVEGAQAGIGQVFADWGWAFTVLPAVTLPLVLASLAYVWRAAKAEVADSTAQEARRFLYYVAPLPILTAIAVQWSDKLGALAVVLPFLLGLWRLSVPLLVTYALLRFRLFGLDLRIKAGFRRGVILGVFTVTFFVASEAAESLVSGDRSVFFGVAAAGALALVSRPVQSLANRAADNIMPDTKPIAAMSVTERRTFYLEQFLLVEADGAVSGKERGMLDALRAQLGLSRREADRLENVRRIDEAVPRRQDRRGDEAAALDAAETDGDSGWELLLRTGLVAGASALVFGMLSEGLESLVPLSSVEAGLLTAAAIALLLAPLERLADRLADRWFPAAQTAADDRRRAQVYREAVSQALADGDLSKRDKVYLGHLQERLGLSGRDRRRLEDEVRAMGRPTPPASVPADA